MYAKIEDFFLIMDIGWEIFKLLWEEQVGKKSSLQNSGRKQK